MVIFYDRSKYYPPPSSKTLFDSQMDAPLAWMEGKLNYPTHNTAQNYSLKACVSVCVCLCPLELSGCMSPVRNARGHSRVFLMCLSTRHYSNEFEGKCIIERAQLCV